MRSDLQTNLEFVAPRLLERSEAIIGDWKACSANVGNSTPALKPNDQEKDGPENFAIAMKYLITVSEVVHEQRAERDELREAMGTNQRWEASGASSAKLLAVPTYNQWSSAASQPAPNIWGCVPVWMQNRAKGKGKASERFPQSAVSDDTFPGQNGDHELILEADEVAIGKAWLFKQFYLQCMEERKRIRAEMASVLTTRNKSTESVAGKRLNLHPKPQTLGSKPESCTMSARRSKSKGHQKLQSVERRLDSCQKTKRAEASKSKRFQEP